MKFFEKKIGNHVYKAGAFPARKALSLKIKLAGLIGPALSNLKISDVGGADSLGGLTSSTGVSITGEEVKAIAIVAGAIGGALSTLEERRFMQLVEEMIELVEVQPDPDGGFVKLSGVFDSIYMCDLGELFLVLAEVFVLNYPFLVGALDRFKGITSKMRAKTS